MIVLSPRLVVLSSEEEEEREEDESSALNIPPPGIQECAKIMNKVDKSARVHEQENTPECHSHTKETEV